MFLIGFICGAIVVAPIVLILYACIVVGKQAEENIKIKE